jgi:hypothetical protein
MVRVWDAPDPLVIHWPGQPFASIYHYPYVYPELMNLEYALMFAVEGPMVNPLLQTARPSPIQKVLAWLDQIDYPPGEEQTLAEQLAEQELFAQEMGLVDLANLPPSPIGGPAPNRDGEVEDIILGAIELLNNQDQDSPDTTMADYGNYPEAAGSETRDEAVGTPTPILGNFIPVSSPSPSAHPQLLQPAVYAPSTVNSTGQGNASTTK